MKKPAPIVYPDNRRPPISGDHEPPVNNPGHKRITWHTAFCDAIRLELLPYAEVLDFDIEHPLTREPLRVDVIIIKKKKDVRIDKNIVAIFRGHNIIEYKSPGDSLTIADFHQVMAYAHLYCTPPEKGAMTDLTVSFVTSREPRELKAYIYMVLMANALKTREVLKMADMARMDKIFEGLGIIEYWEARAEAEKALEIARNLKKIGLPVEQIVKATGLPEQQVNGL